MKTFEEKVIEIVNNYGAPEDVMNEIKDFLITSGNVYAIIEAYQEMEE